MGKHLAMAVHPYIDCTNSNCIKNVSPTDLMNWAAICILYSWCTDVQTISNGVYICFVGYLGTMAVRLYRNCTNWDCGHKCSMHRFNPVGGNSDPVQLMYGRIANLKWSAHMYCGIAGNYCCTPVQKLYESGMRSQMFDAPFQSLWW